MKKINDTTIAMLVDGDNAQPKRLAAIIEEISRQGTITIRNRRPDSPQPSPSG